MKHRAHALTIVACTMIAACGVPGQAHPTQLGDNDVHVAAPATTTTFEPGTRTRHVELCLIADDHLTEHLTELPTPLSVRKTLQALIDISSSALPAGTRSAINAPGLVTADNTTRGTANIDLNAGFTDVAPAAQVLAIAQIVCTLTSLPGIGEVHFTQNGQPIDIPRANRSLTDQPVARDDYKTLLPNH